MFNIGAEGQVYMGALAAVTVGYFTLPSGLHIITGIIFAMIAGAVWSLVPAILKLTRGVHEVISTIMFNWIARFLAFYMVAFILVDPLRGEKTISIPMSARFPILVRGTDLSYSLFAAVLFAIIMYFVLWHTTMGYEVRASGLNPAAARYGGIKSKRTMLMSFILGGLAAGLAGATVVMGNPPTYAVISGLPQLMNVGFDGMAVAMVGRNLRVESGSAGDGPHCDGGDRPCYVHPRAVSHLPCDQETGDGVMRSATAIDAPRL
jgi:simple sugar transport system permease protein